MPKGRPDMVMDDACDRLANEVSEQYERLKAL